MVGGAGGAGRLSRCSSREEGARQPTSPQSPADSPWTAPARRPGWEATAAFWEGDTPEKGSGSGLGKSQSGGNYSMSHLSGSVRRTDAR